MTLLVIDGKYLFYYYFLEQLTDRLFTYVIRFSMHMFMYMLIKRPPGPIPIVRFRQ